MPHILRIQRPGFVHIAGAFDDGAAVGEDGEFAAVGLEFEQEAIVADLAQRFEMVGHVFEIEAGGGAVRHLDGIAAAQAGGARSLFAVEPFKTAALAAGTVHFAQKRRNLDATLDVVPDVHIN